MENYRAERMQFASSGFSIFGASGLVGTLTMKGSSKAEAEWDGGPPWLFKRTGFWASVSTAAPVGAFEPLLRVADGWSRNAISASDGTTYVWQKSECQLLRIDRARIVHMTSHWTHYDIELEPDLVAGAPRKAAIDPKALMFLCLFLKELDTNDAAVAATFVATP